ncbi:hypothetical protein Ancab_026037 [Ancistrocladus abbreviatus]
MHSHYPLILSSLTNPLKKLCPTTKTSSQLNFQRSSKKEGKRMIQELFGGGAAAGLIGSGEQKISIAEGFLLQTSLSPSPSPSLSSSPSQLSSSNPITTTTRGKASTTTTTTTTAIATSNSENQNLRCPRCDSTNTKFCYYNNYNLTQPRHFCKTCRRYWTKGGALRNVPIGGGCRKNKSSGNVSASAGKSGGGKAKALCVPEFGKQSYFGNGFDQDQTSSPVLWAASPQNSPIFALLRAHQNQNQNPNPNPLCNAFSIKNEGPTTGTSEPGILTGSSNARTPAFNSYNEAPSIALCSSFMRNNQQQNGLVLEGFQSGGGHQVYETLKSSSANYYYGDQPAVVLTSNVVSSTSSTTSPTILQSAPVNEGELSFFNPSLSWSGLPTPHGAYP